MNSVDGVHGVDCVDCVDCVEFVDFVECADFVDGVDGVDGVNESRQRLGVRQPSAAFVRDLIASRPKSPNSAATDNGFLKLPVGRPQTTPVTVALIERTQLQTSGSFEAQASTLYESRRYS